jgi:hypothetical protein
MTDIKRSIVAIEQEFDDQEGFLGLLRGGHFDTRSRDRFLGALREVDPGSGSTLDRRLVSLLWYLPLLLSWQEERLGQDELAALKAVEDSVINELERILGVP